MKVERAQDIYSDYAEDSLSPAMKLALEQHFEADPQAKRDYQDFTRVCSLLSEASQQEVECPQGFRAKVLERVATNSAERNRRSSTGFSTALRNLFLQPRRREATGVLVGVFATAIVFAAFMKPSSPVRTPGAGLPTPTAPTTGNLGGPALTTPVVEQPAVPTSAIHSVQLANENGTVYHDIDVRVPDSKATLNAYLITATGQILDPTVRENDATKILGPMPASSDQDVTIPVALTQQPATGSTLNVLVEWKGDGQDGSQAEIVFTPLDTSDDQVSQAAPASSDNFFGSLQAIAAMYHVTVIADASLAPVTSVGAWSAGDSVDTSLDTVAKSAGYAVSNLHNGSYFVYRVAH